MDSLFDITERAIELASREPTCDPDTGEVDDLAWEAYAGTIDEALGEGAKKLAAYRAILKTLAAREKAAREEAARFTERARQQAKKQDMLKERALAFLYLRQQITGSPRVEEDGYLLADIRTTRSVEVVDIEALPERFVMLKPSADKRALAAALKDGPVPGARLEERDSILWGRG
jgi:hypothetical protein